MRIAHINPPGRREVNGKTKNWATVRPGIPAAIGARLRDIEENDRACRHGADVADRFAPCHVRRTQANDPGRSLVDWAEVRYGPRTDGNRCTCLSCGVTSFRRSRVGGVRVQSKTGRNRKPAAGAGKTETTRLLVTPDARTRLAAAADWLAARAPDAEVVVVAPTWEAADDLVRAVVSRSGARFGTTRLTLDHLAARLAAGWLAADDRAPASGLLLGAVAARVIHRLLTEGALSYFAPVATRPGFPTAVARTLDELRMNGVAARALRELPEGGLDLAALSEGVERELADAKLADRAAIFEAAARAAEAPSPPPLAGLPLLLLDLPVTAPGEARLLRALAHRAPAVLATAPAGDARTIAHLEEALGCARSLPGAPRSSGSLAALQAHLFEDSGPRHMPLDGSVELRSWPGEARECIEVARSIQAAAARGVPFDRMAVLLRSPGEYRSHLEEAFRRAAIPAYFAGGTSGPDPAGRALLTLLACAAERLSARRFAEYLSLAQVPDPDAPREPADAFSPPAQDLFPAAFAVDAAAEDRAADDRLRDPDGAGVVAGTVRAPWRWERLLVDASVIGGRDRWARRLRGLEEELRVRRQELGDEDEARAAVLDRQLADVGHLRVFGQPLIDRLAALPEKATWGEWLEHLRELALAALRAPQGVLATLTELEPMDAVGPVDLDEVQLVLAPRLRELRVPPPRRRYGSVFIAPADAARGLAFDIVFVPGLAERLFPRKIIEDPILLDPERLALGVKTLATQPDRVGAERLVLRLAVGAARDRVFLSYPRVDVQQGRPRVPSFYGLEALRAAEGRLPGFGDIRARTDSASSGRLGWPAPERPVDAIDEAEYDLALLAPLIGAHAAAATGTASYLLTANAHLARALRARARRWLRRWTTADGLVDPESLGGDALGAHQLGARSYSPTGLQHFAACPYRFFLQAILRLQPREEAVAVEVLDPLTRGALFHEVQFAVLTRLRAEGLLPVAPPNVDAALAAVDAELDAVAARYAEKLAPAIPRVWDDGINTIRADLREWLRRQADADDGWVPDRFELAFGLADRDRPDADPASVPEAVAVGRELLLRGSIDLVERHPRGVLRATDHKTGKVRADDGVIVGGGQVLQPVLYALAAERLLGQPVEAGRLYYCTSDGGYAERVVPLDGEARASAETVSAVVGRALSSGFLPAAPAKDACVWCDYRRVCGPYEEIRTARKPADRLRDLELLRSLR
jgi:RecB family exonuclease